MKIALEFFNLVVLRISFVAFCAMGGIITNFAFGDTPDAIVYTLSPHAKNVEWSVTDEKGKVIISDNKLPLSIPRNLLKPGDYVVSVTYLDLWNPYHPAPNPDATVTIKLHIVDVRIF